MNRPLAPEAVAAEAVRLRAVVAERISEVRGRIEAAAGAVGRDPSAIRLVAVTKGSLPAVALAAHLAGADGLGENRGDEFSQKSVALREALDFIRLEASDVEDAGGVSAAGENRAETIDDPEWHFVGHLQRNKVRDILGVATWLHSLDSIPLAETLARRSEISGRPVPNLLVEVNVASEPQKHGVRVEGVADFVGHLLEMKMPVRGFMCMAPKGCGEADARRVFAQLASLSHDVCKAFAGTELPELSMGMTDDFEWAVAEGATIVRIGRAITGGVG